MHCYLRGVCTKEKLRKDIGAKSTDFKVTECLFWGISNLSISWNGRLAELRPGWPLGLFSDQEEHSDVDIGELNTCIDHVKSTSPSV